MSAFLFLCKHTVRIPFDTYQTIYVPYRRGGSILFLVRILLASALASVSALAYKKKKKKKKKNLVFLFIHDFFEVKLT